MGEVDSITSIEIAQKGKRGDLEKLVAQNEDFAETLAKALRQDSYPFDGLSTKGTLWAFAFDVVGASFQEESIELYANQSYALYYFANGSLAMREAGSQIPTRIIITKSLDAIISIDEAEDGDRFTASIYEMMPSWAVEKLFSMQGDGSSIDLTDSLAARWAALGDQRAELSEQNRPSHSDPHKHKPDIYSLGQLKSSDHELTIIKIAELPPETEDIDAIHQRRDFELLSTSKDGQWKCYWPLVDDRIIFENTQANEWYAIEGLGELPFEISWAKHRAIFDSAFMDFGWENESGIHVEVDLDSRSIERVIPYGPHNANGK